MWYLQPLSRFRRYLSIKVCSNNIFFILKTIKKNKVILKRSSGNYKIKTTKKSLKYVIKLILYSFFQELNPVLKKKALIIVLVAPIRIRKVLLKYIGQNIGTRHLILKVKEKKPFNGCRPSKKRRKKRKGLRIFN